MLRYTAFMQEHHHHHDRLPLCASLFTVKPHQTPLSAAPAATSTLPAAPPAARTHRSSDDRQPDGHGRDQHDECQLHGVRQAPVEREDGDEDAQAACRSHQAQHSAHAAQHLNNSSSGGSGISDGGGVGNGRLLKPSPGLPTSRSLGVP